MAGHNVCVYLDDEQTWNRFQEACKIASKRPNTVIRNFITQYTRQMLKEQHPLEFQIAQGMVEAKQIVANTRKAKKASDLLKELE